MRNPCRRSSLAACIAIASLFLTACESKVTADSFEQIKIGMTMTQVETLMCASGTDQTASGTSISSAGIGDSKASPEKTIVWKDGNATITVVFKDGKVVHKSTAGM